MENKQKKKNLKKNKKIQLFKKMKKELKKKIWKMEKRFKKMEKRRVEKLKKNHKKWKNRQKDGKSFPWFKHHFLKDEKGKRIERKMQILKILQKSVAYFEAVFVFLTFSPDFLEKLKKLIERDFHGLHMKVFWKNKGWKGLKRVEKVVCKNNWKALKKLEMIWRWVEA